MRPRSFGEILDGAFQIFRSHFLVLGLTTLVPSGLSGIVSFMLTRSVLRGGGSGTNLSTAWLMAAPLWLVIGCATVVVWGALSWQTSEAMIGGRVAIEDGYRAGARSFFRLLGACVLGYILLWIGMVVVMIPLGIVGAVIIPLMAGGAAAGGTGAGIASGAVILAAGIGIMVGMLCVGGALACTLPAVVVEGLGPARALGRSFELSRGAVLRSGVLVMVAVIIAFLPMFGVMLLSGQLTGIFSGQQVTPSAMSLFIQQLGSVAVGAFTTPFLAAVITVLYYDRRVRTEALDVQMAARDLKPIESPT